MSFPGLSSSPAPTAGPLPVVERANLSAAPYGGGGGGGGSVSSFATASISSLSVSSINGAAPGGGGQALSTLALSSLTVSSINGIGGDLVLNAVGGIVVDGPGFGIQFPTDGEIDFQDSKGALVGLSSINGAAYPPAGLGPNPAFSTVTAATGNFSTVNISSLNGNLAGRIALAQNFNLSSISGISMGTFPISGRVSYVGNAFGNQQSASFTFATSNAPSSIVIGQTQIFPTVAWNEMPAVVMSSEQAVDTDMLPIGLQTVFAGDPGSASQAIRATWAFLSTPTRVNIPSTMRMSMNGFGYV